MTRNKQIDLDNHLFAELERLGDESLKGDELKDEINRAKAIAGVASQINASRNFVLQVAIFRDETGKPKAELPESLR